MYLRCDSESDSDVKMVVYAVIAIQIPEAQDPHLLVKIYIFF